MKLFKDKIYPNCSVCRWSSTKKLIIGEVTSFHEICEAQGFGYIMDVYNNGLCKNLYEKRIEIT